MLNPNSTWGRALVIFFWSGLAASIVNMVYSLHHFDPFMIAWLVVIVNIAAVLVKNWLIPSKPKK